MKYKQDKQVILIWLEPTANILSMAARNPDDWCRTWIFTAPPKLALRLPVVMSALFQELFHD